MTDLQALIFDLLGDDEKYGLELAAQSAGKLRPITIYVTLARMEEAGLIVGREDYAGRRVYRRAPAKAVVR